MTTPTEFMEWLCEQHDNDADDDICKHSLAYAERYGTLQEAWDACPYGDWLIYGVGLHSGEPESDERARYVLMLTEIARALVGWATDVVTTTEFIDIIERWAKNRTPTMEEIYETGQRTVAIESDGEARLEYRFWTLYSAITEDRSVAASSGTNLAADYRETLGSSTARSDLADIVRKHYPDSSDVAEMIESDLA